MPGTSTFPVEVTNVSRHGLWLLVGDEELFLPFEHFPWFRDAVLVQRELESRGQGVREHRAAPCRWSRGLRPRRFIA